MNVVFLDIDGVMNSELFYKQREFKRKLNPFYWLRKLYFKLAYVARGFKHKIFSLKELSDRKKSSFKHRLNVIKKETDPRCWKLLASLVWSTKSFICISSTWRGYFTIEEWNRVFAAMGLPNDCCYGITETRRTLRGTEIQEWLSGHPQFKNYAIIDDDGDMLPEQRDHFFQTDGYCGLSPNIVYRIKRLFDNE